MPRLLSSNAGKTHHRGNPMSIVSASNAKIGVEDILLHKKNRLSVGGSRAIKQTSNKSGRSNSNDRKSLSMGRLHPRIGATPTIIGRTYKKSVSSIFNGPEQYTEALKRQVAHIIGGPN